MKTFILLMSLLSSMAFAQQPVYVIDPAIVEITLDKHTVGDDQTTKQSVNVPVYQVQTYIEYVTGTCSKIVCEEVDSDANPTWNGFFTTSNSSEKVRILSDLIKGIGKTTAERIVTYKLINYRPKTWNSFAKAIRYAADELKDRGFDSSFATAVLEQYAYENAIALGYYSTTYCYEEKYTCTYPVEKERKTFAYNIHKELVLNYRGKGTDAILYSFEQEKIKVTIQGNGQTTVKQETKFNNYTNSISTHNNGDKVVLDLRASNRNLVDAPSNMFQATVNFSAQRIQLITDLKSVYADLLTNGNKIQVDYRVCEKKKMSWGNDKCKTALVTGTKLIENAHEQIDVSASLSSGGKYIVDYRIVVLTSSDFASGLIQQATSSTYQAP